MSQNPLENSESFHSESNLVEVEHEGFKWRRKWFSSCRNKIRCPDLHTLHELPRKLLCPNISPKILSYDLSTSCIKWDLKKKKKKGVLRIILFTSVCPLANSMSFNDLPWYSNKVFLQQNQKRLTCLPRMSGESQV